MKEEERVMPIGLLVALALLWFPRVALASDEPAEASDQPRAVEKKGCLSSAGAVDAAAPEETDLEDGARHHGFLHGCVDGRPSVLTLDLVEYYEGAEALAEAARDGESLDPDVDPIVYVRNRNPKLRRLGVKADAKASRFDCSLPGCPLVRVQLSELPWDALYEFRLQDGLIVAIELPYSP